MELPAPVFIDTDVESIVQSLIAHYEQLTSRKLQPGQAEMLLINCFAYREQLVRVGVNEAGKQNLLAFSRYPVLDCLVELLGVFRLPARNAQCTIRLELVPGHGGIILPDELRVQTIDGKAIFKLMESKVAAAGILSIDIKSECTTKGEIGNGYQAGEISIILDPQPYLRSATNIDVSNGGADQETDEELRERARLAPNQFSVAGPADAYIYFAQSAHPAIIDISVTSPVPGQVNIYPLLTDGQQPSTEIMDAIFAACNAEKRRPLNDTVVVEAPERVDYAIAVNLILLHDAVNMDIVQRVRSNLEAYSNERKTRLGVDVIIDQIIGRCMVEGVYKVAVVSPSADIVLVKSKYANCTNISINITGTTDE